MANQEIDGLVLASAGLKRLGLEDLISEYLDETKMIPACGQGILAIQVRQDSELLTMINATGIGPAGYGGKTTALSLNIETHPTHIAGMPVAVSICCHVSRHKEANLWFI